MYSDLSLGVQRTGAFLQPSMRARDCYLTEKACPIALWEIAKHRRTFHSTSTITILRMANNATMYTEGKVIEIAQSVGIMPKNLGGKTDLGGAWGEDEVTIKIHDRNLLKIPG